MICSWFGFMNWKIVFLEGAGLTSRCRYSHIEPKNRNSGINIAINGPEMLEHNTRFSSYLNFSSSLITNV